MWVKELLK
jgi:hypothetical protein